MKQTLPNRHAAAEKLGCLCATCPLKDADAGPILPASLKARRPATLAVVAERPGRSEIEKIRWFAGDSGIFIERVCRRYNIPDGRLHFSNVTLCARKKEPSPADYRKAIECCRPRLVKELKRVRVSQILAYGKWAQWCFTGKAKVSDWMGAQLEPIEEWRDSGVTGVVSTFQPAHVIRPDGRQYQPVTAIHTARAYAFATGKLKAWKWPRIITEPGKEAVAALKKILKQKKPVALDLEDYGDATAPTIMAMGVGTTTLAVSLPCHGYFAKGGEWVAPIEEWPHGNACKRLYRKIVEDPKIKKVYQHGQHDILGLESLGWKPKNYHFDTLIAHAIVAPAMRHKLSLIACIEFHAPRWKDVFAAGTDAKGAEAFKNRRSLELRDYNAKDCIMTVLLYTPLSKRVRDLHRGKEIFAGYMRRANIAISMRRRGIPVDKKRQTYHHKILWRRRGTAKRELQLIAEQFGLHQPFRAIRKRERRDKYVERKREWYKEHKLFNPNANAQVGKLFFDKLHVRVRKYTKTGAASLDKSYLTDLVAHPNILVQTCARALLRFRRYQKLDRTYVSGLPIARDGCVHPTTNVTGAKTQRFSSSDPNMQNVPLPKKKGKRVIAPGLRDMFIAHDGGFMLAADYSQIEVRISALFAQDPKLLEWYARGVDVHRQNAQELFGDAYKRASQAERDNMRYLAKRFIYGLGYGGGAHTIWSTLVIDFPFLTIEAVERIMERWYALHPRIRDWQNSELKFARQHGYTEIPLNEHRIYHIGKPEATKVYNWPIQGSAAHVINEAIERVYAKIGEELVLQVHDELVASTVRPLHVAKVFQKEMPVTLEHEGESVHIPIDIKVGRDYGNCVEVDGMDELERVISIANHPAWKDQAEAELLTMRKAA
jgi:uracil-DNA glycosylase family 4